MLSTIVVADDLTGANATGVLLNNIGEKTMTVLLGVQEVNWNTVAEEYDGVVIPTNSRGDLKEEAYNKVYHVVEYLKGDYKCVFNKRIDSTLRGNVGAEIDAMFDALGGSYVAFVVPAYPKSNRKCIGGFETVDGVILQNTNVAKDPKMPVTKSRVKDIIMEQSNRTVGEVFVDVIESDIKVLRRAILEQIAKGSKIIIFDAMTDEHIEKIAQGVMSVNQPYFTVCPGPFIREIVRCQKDKKHNQWKILLTIGSVTKLSQDQLRFLINRKNLYYQKIDVKKILLDENDSEVIDEIVENVKSIINQYSIVCITTTDLADSYRVDLSVEAKRLHVSVEEVSNRINSVLATITKRLITEDKRIKGLFTSGGDTTLAVARSFCTEALNIQGEIYPLAVSGTLKNQDGSVLEVVTKGGLIGEENGLLKVVEYLMKKIEKKERAYE